MSGLAVIPTPGATEIIVIALIFVLLFGAKKLPELGSSVGKSIKNFKQGLGDAGEDDVDGAEQRSEQTPQDQ